MEFLRRYSYKNIKMLLFKIPEYSYNKCLLFIIPEYSYIDRKRLRDQSDIKMELSQSHKVFAKIQVTVCSRCAR